MKPVKYKISLDNKLYGELSFETIEQVQNHLSQLGLSEGFEYTLGYILEPNEELKKYKRELGELLLKSSLNLIAKGVSLDFDSADCEELGEQLFSKITLPDLTKYTGIIVRKIGTFKVGSQIILPS